MSAERRLLASRNATLGDFLAFVTGRWKVLLIAFVLIAAGLAAIVILTRDTEERPVASTVHLSFAGIETHHYPTGRKFNPSDITAPDVLARALRAVGINDRLSTDELSQSMGVIPVVPEGVLATWRAADRQNQPRPPYLAREFRIRATLDALEPQHRLAVMSAIVDSYRSYLRDELYTSHIRVAEPFAVGENWKSVDPWLVPPILEEAAGVVALALAGLTQVVANEGQITEIQERDQTTETTQLPRGGLVKDPAYAVRFADLRAQFQLFERAELASLAGITFAESVVADRNLAIRQTEHRLRELTHQISRQRNEAALIRQLLTSIERPDVPAARAGANAQVTTLTPELLAVFLRNDYYGDLVRRIADTEAAVAALESRRSRLERSLERLGTATAGTGRPSGYDAVAAAAVNRFQQLLAQYRSLVQDYYGRVAAANVELKEGPYLEPVDGLPLRVVLLAVLLASLVLALVSVSVFDLASRLRRGV